MKETTLSLCEKKFTLQAARELKRLDGRKLEEFRKLHVHFGKYWGSCFASLGETKVLAVVTCEIQQPKATRPQEGILYVNVELSPMAAPHFEAGRSSDLSIHLNRVLERCIKDSKAIDLESLCIVAEEKVWALRIDVNVLNHSGNLVDCASIAALAAVAHFKRPDVTTDGDEIKVHDISERDPIPITLHHYPVCVTFALLNDGESILGDPTALEERVADASLTFGVNAYGELCGLHLGGSALTNPGLILNCSRKASARARDIVGTIKESLKADADARKSGVNVGFAESMEFDKITAISRDRLQIQLKNFSLSALETAKTTEASEEETPVEEGGEVVCLGNHSAELLPPPQRKPRPDNNGVLVVPLEESFGDGGASKWNLTVDQQVTAVHLVTDSSEEDEVMLLPVKPTEKNIENIDLSGDSEEESVVVLQGDDVIEGRGAKVGEKTPQKSEASRSRMGESSVKAKKNKKKRRK